MQMSGFDNRGGWAGGLLTFSSVSRQAKPTGHCWFKEVGSHEETNRVLALLRSAPDGRPRWAISWVLGSEGAASRFPPLSHLQSCPKGYHFDTNHSFRVHASCPFRQRF
jgi:hypothetical protein